MRDFQSDIIHAAMAGEAVPASDFSWSPLRHWLFHFCRRAYFIRYYLAQGGWNIHSHPLARTAYLEKYLPSVTEWMGTAFEKAAGDAVRKAVLRNGADARRMDFSRALVRGLERAVSALRQGLECRDYLTDPKLPGLREAYREESGFLDRELDRRMAEIVAVFGSACAVLLQSGFMELIERLDFMDFRLDERFLQIPRRDFPVWLHAGILCFDAGAVTMFRFRHEPAPGDIAPLPDSLRMENALFGEYAALRWKGLSAACSTFLFAPESAGLRMSPPEMPTDDIIEVSSRAMLSLIDGAGRVSDADFPETEDREKCGRCPFLRSCGMLRGFREKHPSRS